MERADHLAWACEVDEGQPGTANPSLPERRVPLTSIAIGLAAVAGLSDLPAYLAGHGLIDATYARELAADSDWQIVITEARTIADEMKRQGRSLRLYAQVNTGLEPQKAGITPDDTVAFVTFCREELGLTIEGLMCIPPAEENPGPHFALLAKLAERCGLDELSMGMSGDYDVAIGFGATSVRVGSAIFGTR